MNNCSNLPKTIDPMTCNGPAWAARAYTAYGYKTETIPYKSRIGFCAECLDTPTGCYLLGNGYRLYAPRLMRFCCPDRLSPFREGGIHAYSYCSNDPVNAVDPSGHSWFKFLFHGKNIYKGKGKTFDWGYAYMAKHPEKNKYAITVSGHGTSGKVGNRDALEIVQDMRQAGFDTSRYDTHFIVCRSAERPAQTEPSVIESVSAMTGRSSIGYKGKVTASQKTSRTKRSSKGWNTYVDILVFTKSSSDLRSGTFHHARVTKLPSQVNDLRTA